MEAIFRYFWKNEVERKKGRPGCIELNSILNEVHAFARICAPFPVDSIGSSLWDCGFIDAELLLPSLVDWTPDRKINLDLLKLIILRAIALKGIQLQWSHVQQERTLPRLYSLLHMNQANLWLDERLENFASFEKDVISRFLHFVPKQETYHAHYSLWLSMIDNRNRDVSHGHMTKFQEFSRVSKKQDRPPVFLLATVPVAPRKTESIITDEGDFVAELEKREGSSKNRKRKEEKNTKQVRQEGEINPVMHSFEKLETLEDYQGGRRIEDGEDELDSHSNALDELELSSVTRDGKANSTYHQDRDTPSIVQISGQKEIKKSGISYPEWAVNESRYLKDFCTVFEKKMEPKPIHQTKPLSILAQGRMKLWKRRLQSCFNEPVWLYGQKDGSEVDLDRVVTWLSQPERGEQKFFMAKEKRRKDLAISILVDTSLSTDSYLDGFKIIDLIHDSLALTGNLFRSIVDTVSICSFSSATRNHIQFNVIKDFPESWDTFFTRASGLEPSGYTRLGPAIRHGIQQIERLDNRDKIIFLITDGKPTDLDRYEGRYGQEDVRMAVREGLTKGIRFETFAISDLSISTLRHVFGNVKRVERPEQLLDHMVEAMKRLIVRR